MNKLDDYPELLDWVEDTGIGTDMLDIGTPVVSIDELEPKLVEMAAEIADLKRKLKRSEPVPVFKMHESVYFDDIKVRITNVKTYCNTCARFLDAPVYNVLVPYHGLAENVPESLLKFEEEL